MRFLDHLPEENPSRASNPITFPCRGPVVLVNLFFLPIFVALPAFSSKGCPCPTNSFVSLTIRVFCRQYLGYDGPKRN
ncbi:hypothetical protein BDV12DRAFT_99261 [Aspergillus spectabilis]